jgi:hypothetical protein
MKVLLVYMHIERGMGASEEFLGVAANNDAVFKILEIARIKNNWTKQFMKDCFLVKECEVTE